MAAMSSGEEKLQHEISAVSGGKIDDAHEQRKDEQLINDAHKQQDKEDSLTAPMTSLTVDDVAERTLPPTTIVLDLDDTLIDFRYDACAETVAVLNFFQDQGFELYIASFNLDAERILTELGLAHYFRGFSVGERNPATKVQNLKELNVSRATTVMFDDHPPHIVTGRADGWNFVQVNGRIGISWANVEYAFPNLKRKMVRYRVKRNNVLRTVRVKDKG